jgi:hypothetical protein
LSEREYSSETITLSLPTLYVLATALTKPPTLQQIINERISFFMEQIKPSYKPEVNKTFRVQIVGLREWLVGIQFSKLRKELLDKKYQKEERAHAVRLLQSSLFRVV